MARIGLKNFRYSLLDESEKNKQKTIKEIKL